MTLKKVAFFMTLLVFLIGCVPDESINIEEKQGSSTDQIQAKEAKDCPPTINFPMTYAGSANSSSLDNLFDDCVPENYSINNYSSISPLEKFYNCKYNPDGNTILSYPPYVCSDPIDIPLYDGCLGEEFGEFDYSFFPVTEPVSNSDYYFEIFGSPNTSILTEAHYNTIADYAKTRIDEAIGDTNHAYLKVKFFIEPGDCATLCGCETEFENGVTTLTGCGSLPVLYVRIIGCSAEVSLPIPPDVTIM